MIFLLDLSLFQLNLSVHFFFFGKLHDEIWISRLALSNGRFEIDDELDVDVVCPWEKEELDDGGVEDLVVVRLAAQSEEIREHVHVEATSAEYRTQRSGEMGSAMYA